MADLLNVALSGLLTHQRGLGTAGHNIANAGNEGFSRQINVNEARNPEFLGGNFFGTGVDVTSVRRSVNTFFVNQLRNDTSALSEAETLRINLDQLDLLIADRDTGLSGNLERFFSALQGANNDPTSIPARQVVLSEAQNLVNKFNSLGGLLDEQQRVVNLQIESTVAQISGLAEQIAGLNLDIIATSGQASAGEFPNDLLDERDRLLQELSSLVSTRVIDKGDGTTDVFIGNGQALVLQGDAVRLITQPSDTDIRNPELAIQNGNITVSLSQNVSGGELGALLEIRGNVLSNTLNSLGRVALGIADAINQQHTSGLDLQGNLGANFFTDINSAAAVSARTIPSSLNTLPQDHLVAVTISDTSQLTTSDYSLTFTGPNQYSLVRRSDGATNTAIDPSLTGTLPGLPTTLQFDGLDINLDRPSGAFAAGDSFLLRPTRQGAQAIDLAIGQAEAIALAAPVRSSANINNSGTGAVSAGVVTDIGSSLFATPGQLSPPLLIRFTSPTSYDILDNTNPAAPVALAPPQTGLAFPPVPSSALLPAAFGVELEVIGQPQAGDTFSLDFNSNGVQDNRNGLLLSGLQTQPILDGNAATLEAGYGRLLQEVGSLASSARVNEQAALTLQQQSQARRDEVSAVNLDEEAAKLIELEQGYNASAQVIGIARSIFETLLSAVR